MTAKLMAELDKRDHQLKQRMAELRDEFTAVQHETVSAAAIQRAVALFDSIWDLLLVPESSRLEERADELEQRMAELRDELAAVQRETVSDATPRRHDSRRRLWQERCEARRIA